MNIKCKQKELVYVVFSVFATLKGSGKVRIASFSIDCVTLS